MESKPDNSTGSIPISKRSVAIVGPMLLIKELNDSVSEHAVLAMCLIIGLTIIYLIADEAKRRWNIKRNLEIVQPTSEGE